MIEPAGYTHAASAATATPALVINLFTNAIQEKVVTVNQRHLFHFSFRYDIFLKGIVTFQQLKISIFLREYLAHTLLGTRF